MKKILTMILFCLNIWAYSYQTWIKQSDYLGSNLVTLENGEILLTGVVEKSSDNKNMAIIKTNANGEILFSKSGGWSGNDSGDFILKNKNGEIFCVGSSSSFSETNWGVWVVKLDENQNIVWQKFYMTIEEAYCYNAITASDGGLLVALTDYEIGGPLYLLRIDNSGNILWQKKIGVSGSDFPMGISEDTKEGFFILFQRNFSTIIIKVDDAGNIWWAKELASTRYFWAKGLYKEDDGVLVLAATSDTENSGQIAVVKFDADCNIIWKRGYNTNFTYASPSNIAKSEDGSYILSGCVVVGDSGSNDFDAFLLKTDTNGYPLWQKRFGENLSDNIIYCQETASNEILVAGNTEILNYKFKSYVGKLDASGSFDFFCNYEKDIAPMTLADIMVGISEFFDFNESDYSFTLISTDVDFSDDTFLLSDLCSPTCPAIDISPSSLQSGRSGETYSAVLTASGGTAPYKFSISSGILPKGLSLSESGVLSGTPSEGGDFNFTVTATDSSYCSGSKNYTLHIEVVPPTISSVQKLPNPFRLKISGSNFHSDLKVYIGGDSNAWGSVKYKSSSEIVLKGGNALKSKFPKGVPVEIKIVNGDGGSATYQYTR